jgi:hypothetical protein
MFQNHPKTLPISHVPLKAFGHTGENSPEVLRAPLARVVPRFAFLLEGAGESRVDSKGAHVR